MPVQLQYTLQRSQPFSALSYPHPRSTASNSAKGKGVMVNLITPSRNPEFITKDYYATAYSPTSTWSSSSSSSDSDNESNDDEFCFDDMESESLTAFSSRASTSSAMTSPQLCTCNSSRKSSLLVGDAAFTSQADYNDYSELVRSQTRNIAKRRASSSAQQSSLLSQPSSLDNEPRGRSRQRHLRKLEEEQEESRDVLPQANSVPELDYNRYTASDYTSSFEPSLLASKLEALLVASPSYSPTFTAVDSLPSLDLDSSERDDYDTDEETDIEEGHELVKVQAHAVLPASPKKAPQSEARFERALAFAQWSRRGRAGVWESPEGVSETVRGLVASIEAQ